MITPTKFRLPPRELAAVHKRLRRVVADYLKPTPRLNLVLEKGDLLDVIDCVVRESKNEAFRLPWVDTPAGFFLAGLFEELVQQPSNIFETIQGMDGQSYHVPLDAEKWQCCLEHFRNFILKDEKLLP